MIAVVLALDGISTSVLCNQCELVCGRDWDMVELMMKLTIETVLRGQLRVGTKQE